MTRLIDDLLDVSRISRNALRLQKERVELTTIIENAVEAVKPLFEASGHKLSIDLPSEPLVLECDVTRIAQVVSNLLNNAAKYTDAGGRIAVSARREGTSAVISETPPSAVLPCCARCSMSLVPRNRLEIIRSGPGTMSPPR